MSEKIRTEYHNREGKWGVWKLISPEFVSFTECLKWDENTKTQEGQS